MVLKNWYVLGDSNWRKIYAKKVRGDIVAEIMVRESGVPSFAGGTYWDVHLYTTNKVRTLGEKIKTKSKAIAVAKRYMRKN